MKEAFGGVFLMRLLLVFIFVYLVFAAISYNYAQAFRLKNSLITYIEEQDINDFNEVLNAADGKVLQGIDDILNLSTYRVSCGAVEGLLPTDDPIGPQKYCYHGIVISTEEVGHLIHHNVSTFVYWNLPVLNTFLMHAANSENTGVVKDAAWEITGDAVVVKRTDVPDEDNRNQRIIDSVQESRGTNGGNVSSGMGNNTAINVADNSNGNNNSNGSINNSTAGITNSQNGSNGANNNNASTSNETEEPKECPTNYSQCNYTYNERSQDEEGNLERNLLDKIISNKGLNLNNSCCKVTDDEPEKVRITHLDGTPYIYDKKIYGTIEKFIKNNADLIVEDSIRYCHNQNKFSTNVQVGGVDKKTNQMIFVITCSSIDITALDD